ncbi:GyrI-like domain-containing protein [Enterococcus sp. DIV0086]|uniref:GyrI-like domain-containing protein n=1 Tax=Enterococcus sp. DIV0086 TaxID=2774655 RepID=UPI003D2CEF1E
MGIKQFKEDKVFCKEDLMFKLMIRKPEFIRSDFALKIVEDILKSKPNEYNEKIKFEIIEEGLCVHALHLGSYDTESITFSTMNEYCEENKLQRLNPYHKEIYLNDPRKTEPEKNKTVLRYSVEKI